MGFRYIIASLAIYDEYSNDVLDIYLPKGSCFPRFYLLGLSVVSDDFHKKWN